MQTYKERLQFPHIIIDIDKIKIRETEQDLEFLVAISCANDDSETNFLYFYTLRITNDSATFNLKQVVSAYSLQLNTFKVTKLIPVQESNLLFAIDEDRGAFVFNLTAVSTGVGEQTFGQIDLVPMFQN